MSDSGHSPLEVKELESPHLIFNTEGIKEGIPKVKCKLALGGSSRSGDVRMLRFSDDTVVKDGDSRVVQFSHTGPVFLSRNF